MLGALMIYSLELNTQKTLNTLMTYINQDIPVVLSIKTRSKEDLKGSIMAYPSGHLIVLTGFTQIDGTWYALVNDPAEYDDFKVKRIYKLSELLDAFKGYTYVLKNNGILVKSLKFMAENVNCDKFT